MKYGRSQNENRISCFVSESMVKFKVVDKRCIPAKINSDIYIFSRKCFTCLALVSYQRKRYENFRKLHERAVPFKICCCLSITSSTH